MSSVINNENNEMNDDLRPEYDLSKLKGGVRGKYTTKYREGTNLILLAPDVAEIFKDNESVNEALRLLIKIAGEKYAPTAQQCAAADFAGFRSQAPSTPQNR